MVEISSVVVGAGGKWVWVRVVLVCCDAGLPVTLRLTKAGIWRLTEKHQV